jgi:hypothetical protein
MRRKIFIIFWVVIAIIIFFVSSSISGEPKGAKAIFDSGEGPAKSPTIKTWVGSGTPVEKTQPSKMIAQKEPYVGISYKIALLQENGEFKIVPKSRIFKSGEKVKLLIRTNKSGYMTILNVGPTGNTNVLFNEYVEAYTNYEIPKTSAFKFVPPPGTEKLIIMLSNKPNLVAQSYASAAPEIISSMEYGRGAGAKGAKDIVVDEMESSYGIISSKNWKPLKMGAKDMIVESTEGSHYGVIPVSSIPEDGILTVIVKLTHR